MQIEIKPSQRDAILAGLRLLQQELIRNGGQCSNQMLHDIYTNGQTHQGLTLHDISALCETINV